MYKKFCCIDTNVYIVCICQCILRVVCFVAACGLFLMCCRSRISIVFITGISYFCVRISAADLGKKPLISTFTVVRWEVNAVKAQKSRLK